MKKKILAFLLSLTMVIGMIPTVVFAEGTQQTTALDLTTQETTDSLETEGWAWNAETKTLTLDGLDIVTDATPAVTVPAGTTIILADGSENNITTTASNGRGIECAGSMSIKTADGYAAEGTLNITTGTSGRGIIYRPASPVPTAVDVAFNFSNIVLNITDAQRAIESTFDVTVTDGTDSNDISVAMTGTEFTHITDSADRGIQVYNSKGYATLTVENSAIVTEGFVYAYGNSQSLMAMENSTVTAQKIKLGWWNTHTNLAKLDVNNSTLVVKNLNGSDAAIEVGVNGAVVAEATLKNSRIIAVNNKDGAISVSRKPVGDETNETARGTLTIANCEVFLSDRDKAGLTHLSQATIADSDITTMTAPADTTVTVTVENNNFNLTLPAGTVIKSGGETYTTAAETALTLDTNTQILSVPVNTTLVTTDGNITTESVMTIAPGQVLSAENTFKISANISSSADKVVVGENIFVSVNASANGTFNASQLEITYPFDSFTFSETDSTLKGATVTAENGVVKLVDYGEAQSYGDSVYTLVFTATQSGDAGFALVSAGFGTLESADANDLTKADCNVISTTVTVKNNVTLSDIFSGETSVYRGDNYTFGKEENTGAYYDYTSVSATMGGSSVTVTDNNDGTWTIENVTGDLVITGNRTEKTFNVSYSSTQPASGADTATYGTDYSFTLPADVAAGVSAGTNYSLASVTIGGNAYSGATVSGKTVTIPGTAITGDIVIVITETTVDATMVNVSVTGNGAGAATGNASTANKNGSYTLTLTPDAGYVYTVTAADTTGTIAVTNNDDNTYSITVGTTDVTFTVTKAVDVADVAVSDTAYISLDDTAMWLVKIGTAKIDGKVYTYNGQNMYWSEKYNAYCTLVVASAKPTPTATDFNIIDGTATEVDYGKDVNMTNTVDANDAQLVWNMYNTQYSDFTTNVTIEKFLRADVNGDGKVDMEDAAAIVTFLLG